MEQGEQDYDGEADLVGPGGERLTALAEERELIGYLLNNPERVDDVAADVSSEDFFEILHRRIFAVLVREGGFAGIDSFLQALGNDRTTVVIDGLTVPQYISRLMVDAAPALDIVAIAQLIQECSERRAIGVADDMDNSAPFQSRMGLKMWVDQNDPGQETEYLIEDLVPEGELVMLIGETQAGKSFLGTHLGLCLARGVPFFGRRIAEPAGVVWCAYEAATGAAARMRGYRRAHRLDLEDIPFAALQSPIPLWPNVDNVNNLLAELKGVVRQKFAGRPLKLIVIDTYNTATPGASEIDSEVVSRIRAAFRHLIKETGATVMIVGHVNSAGKHRGNEQLVNNADTVLKVSRKTRVDGRETVPVRDGRGREVRTLKVVKQREGQDGLEHDFVLSVIEDGTKNKYGNPRTTCYVSSPVWEQDEREQADPKRESAAGWRVTKSEALFLNCLVESLAEFGVAPPAELSLPRSIDRVVDYEIVKRMMLKRVLRDDDDTPDGRKRHANKVSQANRRCRTSLMNARVVGCHDPFIWWTGKPVRGIRALQPDRGLFDAPDNEPDFAEDDFPI